MNGLSSPGRQDLATSSLDQPAIVPVRLVDGLSALQLPAGEVHIAGPHHSDCAPEAIDCDRFVPDRPKPHGGNQTALRRWPIPRSADTVPLTMLDLGCVYA